jgi:pSer/pThr/pTyr-binding forkhead associated (FHA) protein
LVQRLPVPLRAGGATVAPAAPVVTPEERPTHVVYRGRARAIVAAPLLIGMAVPEGRRALQVPAGPGISRVHCTLARAADGVWLEDLSTYGTLVNGERVAGRVALRAGDRLRLGAPGVECELVRVVDDDGAA